MSQSARGSLSIAEPPRDSRGATQSSLDAAERLLDDGLRRSGMWPIRDAVVLHEWVPWGPDCLAVVIEHGPPSSVRSTGPVNRNGLPVIRTVVGEVEFRWTLVDVISGPDRRYAPARRDYDRREAEALARALSAAVRIGDQEIALGTGGDLVRRVHTSPVAIEVVAHQSSFDIRYWISSPTSQTFSRTFSRLQAVEAVETLDGLDARVTSLVTRRVNALGEPPAAGPEFGPNPPPSSTQGL